MKGRIGFALIVAIFLTVMSCDKPKDKIEKIKGSWKVGEKEVTIGDIGHVEFYSPGDIFIEIGEKPELRIEADDNILPYLITREEDGKLVVMIEAGYQIVQASGYSMPPPITSNEQVHVSRVRVHLVPRRRIKYYLIVRNLEGIISKSRGNVTIPDLKGESIKIDTGFSDFTIGKLTAKEVSINMDWWGMGYLRERMMNMNIESLSAEELKLQIKSNLNVNIAGGELHRQEITIHYDGNYDALKVYSVEADVRINGSGSATVRVSKRLNVHLMDCSGNVYYTGEPEITESRQSEASGELIKITE